MSGPPLTDAQRAALAHVRRGALGANLVAHRRLASVLHREGLDVDPETMATSSVRHGRITLNFHPDRLLPDGRTVVAAMLDDGHYRSQFETRITSGSPTAFAGGDRDRWEHLLFGGAYQADGVAASERPKYGALERMGHADGAAPRFGSCHVQLRPATLDRATFCLGDSHLGPAHLATSDVFAPVVSGLLRAVASDGQALGRPGMDVSSTLALLLAPSPHDEPPRSGGPAATHGRALDDYIEAQVHGSIVWGEDIERLVADPSFRGTGVGEQLARLAARHAVPLVWHPGFSLDIDSIPDDFRGPEMRPLARRLRRELGEPSSRLDAALIGRGAASLTREPDRWLDRGASSETWQHLKQLWHVLVRFGEPSGAAPGSG